MKKIVKNFEKIINSITGKLVWIGLDDDFLMKKISANHNIVYCDILNGISPKGKGKAKGKKEKNLSIKDFRKYFKKKNIDCFIVNIKDIDKLLPRFIPDSIYITSKTIYIYGDKTYDYEKIMKRYKRYSKDIKLEIYDDNFLIKIDVTKSKNHFFKDKLYFALDNIINLIDMISDLIVS